MATPEDADELFDQVGPALSRLRRRAGSRRTDPARNVLLNLITEPSEGWTVGGVAAELGISQPVASRTVAGAISDGLVRRVASQADGRSATLRLTAAGRAEQQRLAQEQRTVFLAITEGWSDTDRRSFAAYLVRYSRDAAEWSGRRRDHDTP